MFHNVCLPQPAFRPRRRGRIVLVLVIFATLLSYVPLLLAVHLPPALVVPTMVGTCMLAIQVARRVLTLVDPTTPSI